MNRHSIIDLIAPSRLSPSPQRPRPAHSRSGSSSLSGPSIPPSTHSSLPSGNSSSSIPAVASPATLPHLPGSGTATPIPGPIFLPPSAAPNPAPVQPAPLESREEDVSSAMGLLQALVSVFADDGDRIRFVWLLLQGTVHTKGTFVDVSTLVALVLHLCFAHHCIMRVYRAGASRRVW